MDRLFDKFRLGARDLEKYQSGALTRCLSRLPPETGSAGGEDQRPACRPGLLNSRSGRRCLVSRYRSIKAAKEIAARIRKGNPRPFEIRANVRLDHLSLNRRHHQAAKPAHPAGVADRFPALPACCMYWTNPASGCISATTPSFWNQLKGLRDMGNTVIVVEHDEDAIRQADRHRPGPAPACMAAISSPKAQPISWPARKLTGKYLTGAENIPIPASADCPRTIAG